MKAGDYVRTDTGRITKIKNIIDFGKENEFEYLNYNDVCVLTTENDYNQDVAGCRGRIIKSSPNIIDLIEVGDIAVVSGVKYTIVRADDMFDGRLFIQKIGPNPSFTTIKYLIEKKELQAIVTKEQFESMEYRTGE